MLLSIIERIVGHKHDGVQKTQRIALSRRQALLGIGAAGLCALTMPAVLRPSDAKAEEASESRPDGDYEIAYSHGRGGGGHFGGDRRRYSRRELRRRCRNDRRFRWRNRDLCRRVERMDVPRRGSCIRVGPVEICEW